MDLGNDFYLVKLQFELNYSKILHEGPWFIGQNFLTIRQWEPRFNPEKAECKETASWIHLPRLPSEFYDIITLRKIGNKIGRILKVDAHACDAIKGGMLVYVFR